MLLSRCGSKNGHQKGIMCLNEIGLHAQSMVTIIFFNSQHDHGGLFDHLMSRRIFTLIMNKIYI